MGASRTAVVMGGLACVWLLGCCLGAQPVLAVPSGMDGTLTIQSDSQDLSFDVWPLGGAGQVVSRRVTASVTASQPYVLTVRMRSDQLLVSTGGESYQIDPRTGYPLKDALGNYVYEFGGGLESVIPAARISFRRCGSSESTALSSAPVTIAEGTPSGTTETRVYRLVFETVGGEDFGWDVLAGAYTNDLVFELRPAESEPPADEDPAPDIGEPTAETAPTEFTETSPAVDSAAPEPAVDATQPPESHAESEPAFSGPASFTELTPGHGSSPESVRPVVSFRVHDPAGIRYEPELALFLDGVAARATWSYDVVGEETVYLEDEDRWIERPVLDRTRARIECVPDDDLAPGIHQIHAGVTNEDDVESTCAWAFQVPEPGSFGVLAAIPAEAVFATPTIEVTASVASTLSVAPETGLGRLLWLGPAVLAPVSPESPISDLDGYSLQLWADDIPVGLLLPASENGFLVCTWETIGAAPGTRKLTVVATKRVEGSEPPEPSIVMWERCVMLHRAEEPR